MPCRLHYTNKNYLNLVINYGECDKVISRLETFPNNMKRITENFKIFGSVTIKAKRNNPVVINDIEISIEHISVYVS